MVKRIATTLVAVAMGATALGATPAFADDATPTPTPTPTATPSPTPTSTPEAGATHGYKADPRVLWFDVTPGTVVVKRHGSVEVTAKVRTKDTSKVWIWLSGPTGGHYGDGDHWLAKSDDTPASYDKPTYDFASRSFTINWNQPTGLYKVHVEAVGVNGKRVSADRAFLVKHEVYAPKPQGPKATRVVGFNASPEPVRKGHKLSLKGELQVAQCYGDWYYKWDSYVSVHGGPGYCSDSRNYWNDWHWLGHQDIGVYFLPKGSTHWKYVRTIDSYNGSFSTSVRATQSGTWGVRFDGTYRLKGSEAYDYVKVVR